MSGPVLCAIDVDHPDHEAPVLVRAGQIARLDRVGLAVLTVMPEFHSAAVAGIFPVAPHVSGFAVQAGIGG